MRIEWRAIGRSRVARDIRKIGAIHRAGVATGVQVAHRQKRFVRVPNIVVTGIAAVRAQVHWAQRNFLSQRIHAVVLNIGTVRNQHRILKQIIGRAILLEDDDDVLNR